MNAMSARVLLKRLLTNGASALRQGFVVSRKATTNTHRRVKCSTTALSRSRMVIQSCPMVVPIVAYEQGEGNRQGVNDDQGGEEP